MPAQQYPSIRKKRKEKKRKSDVREVSTDSKVDYRSACKGSHKKHVNVIDEHSCFVVKKELEHDCSSANF